MKPIIRIGAWAVGVVAATAVIATCGGGTGTSGTQTAIDLASVQTGIEIGSSVFNFCRTTAGLRSAIPSDPVRGKAAWLIRMLELGRGASLRASGNRQSLFDPTKPDDQFGDCGGRITFPSYNHSSGTTTGTVTFDDYCTVDSETGERSIADGNISFVDNGTPSASGPISNSVEANSPNGVTLITQTAGGTQLTAQKLVFTDFLYDVGVPGGSPTASNPDRITLDESRLSDLVTGKTYRQTAFSFTAFDTPSGGTQATFSGRGYRSNGDYYDVSTTTPLTANSSGDLTGGQVTFTGANGSNAVMTLVPGSTPQATMTVNGTPVTNVPSCQ